MGGCHSTPPTPASRHFGVSPHDLLDGQAWKHSVGELTPKIICRETIFRFGVLQLRVGWAETLHLRAGWVWLLQFRVDWVQVVRIQILHLRLRRVQTLHFRVIESDVYCFNILQYRVCALFILQTEMLDSEYYNYVYQAYVIRSAVRHFGL
jgi:hypothetical protein